MTLTILFFATATGIVFLLTISFIKTGLHEPKISIPFFILSLFCIAFFVLIVVSPHHATITGKIINEGTITDMHICGDSYIIAVNGTEYRVDFDTFYSLHVGDYVKVYLVSDYDTNTKWIEIKEVEN